ncbi:MAG: hypothetical protein AAGI12_02870 [Pseudomonadota bacterium]
MALADVFAEIRIGRLLSPRSIQVPSWRFMYLLFWASKVARMIKTVRFDHAGDRKLNRAHFPHLDRIDSDFERQPVSKHAESGTATMA